MITEVRHYIPIVGKEAELVARFHDSTFDIFDRMGFEMSGFYVTTDGSGHLFYLMNWSDEQAMAQAWQRFRDDPEWQQLKTQSEAAGPLVERIDSYVTSQLT